ncbi:tropomyosin [Neisseria sp. 74A18]|nr:tropomyosin [Neisseria sp. 74A18]
MQQQMFDTAFAEFTAHQIKTTSTLTQDIATHAENITVAAAKLETYREQLLVELAQQASNQIKETEDRVYASVSKRVIEDVEAANAAFIDSMKKLLMFVSAAWVIGLLLLVGVVVFK